MMASGCSVASRDRALDRTLLDARMKEGETRASSCGLSRARPPGPSVPGGRRGDVAADRGATKGSRPNARSVTHCPAGGRAHPRWEKSDLGSVESTNEKPRVAARLFIEGKIGGGGGS